MLPNFRLVVATIFSTATLAFFFIAFASYRVALDGLDRLPSSSVPAILQLGFATDEKWSQRDSLNGAIPEIFRSLPQNFADSAETSQVPEITVVDVPVSPEPAPETLGANDAAAPVEVAAPAAVVDMPRETARPETVAAVDTQEKTVPVAEPPAAAPAAAPAPAAKMPAQAAVKPAPKAKPVKHAAAKPPARPHRKVATRRPAKPGAPAAVETSPAAAKPTAKNTNAAPSSGPFSSLFQ